MADRLLRAPKASSCSLKGCLTTLQTASIDKVLSGARRTGPEASPLAGRLAGMLSPRAARATRAWTRWRGSRWSAATLARIEGKWVSERGGPRWSVLRSEVWRCVQAGSLGGVRSRLGAEWYKVGRKVDPRLRNIPQSDRIRPFVHACSGRREPPLTVREEVRTLTRDGNNH